MKDLPTALLGLASFGPRWGLATSLPGGDGSPGPGLHWWCGLPPREWPEGWTGQNSFTFCLRAEKRRPSHQRRAGPSARGGLWPSICGVAGPAAQQPHLENLRELLS